MTRVGIPHFDSEGNVLDKQGYVLARRNEISSYEVLPPNTTITLSKVNGVWPGVPTSRADTIIIWKGEDPSPPIVSVRTVGEAAMLDGVDLRIIV